MAFTGFIGIGIAAIGLHLFFPLAIIAGWIGSTLFMGRFEEQARLKALGKIRLDVDQRYRENIPDIVAEFEKQWNDTANRICAAVRSDFDRHCEELQAQLDAIVLQHKDSERSANKRRSEIDELRSELDAIRACLVAEQC